MPLEPPSLVWDITRLRPALDIDTDPVDRSDQQSTPTLSLMSHRHCQGQSAEPAAGEKCLVNGTYPHITPVVSRRPLTCPRQPPFRRSLRPARPVPIRCTNSCPTESVGRCEAAGSGGVDDRPDMMSTRRSTMPLPQATVGSGGNHPQLAARRPPPADSKSLAPCASCWAHCPKPAPAPMSRTFGQSSGGVTQTTRSATHPVHLWLKGPESTLS
jgi:hypothetical protein